MRTTLTLDDDIAAKLAAEARRSGRSFKAVVNESLRLGLLRTAKVGRIPFRVQETDLGIRDGIDLSNVEDVLDHIEGPRRR